MQHDQACLLLADAEWLRLAPAIIFFLVWLVNHLLSAGKAKPAGRPVQRAPMAPPRPQPVAPPANQSRLASEIEDFLRRANERRLEMAREAQSGAPPAPRPRTMTPPIKRAPEAPVDVEVVEVGPPGESVAAHVARRLANRQFEERGAHLADDILKTDIDRKQHERQVFGHHVGMLKDTSTSAENTAPVVPDALEVPTIAALLRSGPSVKQAIILNEILSRPEHRW